MEQVPQTELYTIGKQVSSDFFHLAALLQLSQAPEYRHLVVEEQRYKIWAHSLGLYQQGHASLDYRVRDAEVVKSRLADILEELHNHLDNLLAITRNERLPYEKQGAIEEVEEFKGDNESDLDSQSGSSYNSGASSSQSNDSSVYEVKYRLQSLTEALDMLYSLAAKIRCPQNRPQRTMDQLYKRVPGEIRAAYIQEREEVEIAAITYLHRQYLIENIDRAEAAKDIDDVLTNYSSTDHWILRRTGVANTRRKQQFSYWKEHAIRLGQMTVNEPVQQNEQTIKVTKQEPTSSLIQIKRDASAPEQTNQHLLPNSTTTATKLQAGFLNPDDLRSNTSHQTRASTVISPRGQKLEWPDPPSIAVVGGYFTCPYCKILCPQKYLGKDAWIVHLIHDLQPYHCTYEQCQDPARIYGTRQEWIDHERQHTLVWHCQEHSEEFETQPDFTQHLKNSHPDSKPEHFSSALIAAVIGPSIQIHRDCPFCPTTFSDISQMQSHLIFHLERLAQLALPTGQKDSEHGTESGHSSQSHQVQMRGRQGSILRDFDISEDGSSYEGIGEREGKSSIPDLTLLTEETLKSTSERLSGYSVDQWIQDTSSQLSVDTNVSRGGVRVGLGDHIPRWRPGSELRYIIQTESFPAHHLADSVADAAARAASMWQGIGARFKQVGRDDPATFAIKYERPDDRGHNVFVKSFFPQEEAGTLSLYSLALGERNVGYLVNILAHEFGHILGLRHESTANGEIDSLRFGGENAQSVMNYFADLSMYRVNEHDLEGLKSFYEYDKMQYRGIPILDHEPGLHVFSKGNAIKVRRASAS